MKGRVIKILSFEYYVYSDGQTYKCSSRKKLKQGGDIYVGDEVEFVSEAGSFAVEKVFTRKNSLIRPYVANIDAAFIVVAPEPQADYVLCDKIIANCLLGGIRPIVCFNKTDIAAQSMLDEFNYDYATFDRIVISARTGEGMEKLREEMRGLVCCLAGQSAVGKTSIINSLTGGDNETGELSKILRGKNTTRHTEAYETGNGGLLIDTCGFSLLTLDIPCDELRLCYDEFEKVGRCRFSTCKHINEPDCAVKTAVEKGLIPKGRYERYITIYEELKRRKKIYE